MYKLYMKTRRLQVLYVHYIHTPTPLNIFNSSSHNTLVGAFKLVQIIPGGLGKGWGPTVIEEDSVFLAEGEVLDKTERTMKGLSKMDNFLLWHEYLVPRLRASAEWMGRKKKVARVI